MRALQPILIEVSAGELLDRLTILRIKASRIADPSKLVNIQADLDAITAAVARDLPRTPELFALIADLRLVNEALWDVEDELRLLERRQDFGPRFIELARAVYQTNDRRAALKRDVDDRLGSRRVEEKSYTA